MVIMSTPSRSPEGVNGDTMEEKSICETERETWYENSNNPFI